MDCTQTTEQGAGHDECTARGSGHSAPVEFSSLCRPPPPGSGSKRGDCSQGKESDQQIKKKAFPCQSGLAEEVASCKRMSRAT